MAIDLKDQKQGEIDRKNVKRFMQKFKYNWSTDVKRMARHVLSERMQKKMEQAMKPRLYEEFKEMQRDVLAKFIAYNRRRPGELQVLK